MACSLTSLAAVGSLAFVGTASGAATATHSAGGAPVGEPRIRRLAFGSILGLCLVAAFVAPSSGAVAKEKPVYYLALGDSLAIGVQPTATSASGATEDGYADQLADMLRAEIPDLRLVKLGCGGESTATMVGVVQPTPSGEGCGPGLYPHGTQLAEAVSFLHAHRNHLALITIDIGANDTFCLLDLDRACFDAGMQHIRTNLAKILQELQAAAGPNTVIVGMTYYNPFAVFWFDDPAYARAIDDLFIEFNGVLQQTYADADVPVADVGGAFHVGEFPLSADLVCRWTWMCTPSPLGPDIHPNRQGYRVIASAFDAARQR
ncbi:MAG TPA: SGNH/GDSL hydrolase family protein [Jiangellales bacterium]|nr:SGNH/GDSL hydrolase family protein [Jiangellales bacterium]